MTATDTLAELSQHRFLRLDVELEPVGSPTFQPATFANTGHSFYQDRKGRLSVVVESVASMANMLEATVWNEAEGRPIDPVAPLPWVEVRTPDGAHYTSSRTAAHRLFAAAMVNGTVEGTDKGFDSLLKGKLGGDPRPPVARTVAAAAWELDPLTLLHGLWIASPKIWDGRARLTRALSARIDAHEVWTQDVQVGGQKTADSVVEAGEGQSGRAKGDQAVFGEIPHHTSEVSAASILARIVLDLGLLRSYGLGVKRELALIAVGALQIRELLDAWPRRRSRCTLLPVDGSNAVKEPAEWTLPEGPELRAACLELCGAAVGDGEGAPLVVVFDDANLKAKVKARKEKAQEEGG